LLSEKVTDRSARIGVIGLGYVGLPLAVEFGKAGFKVTGLDVEDKKCAQINAGESYIQDVPTEELKDLVRTGRMVATSDFAVLRDVDCVSICVPTPLRKTKDPDVSYIVAAVEQIFRYMHKDQLIVLESTTYPGTTEEVILPILSRSNLTVGTDFYLAFSPERVDPGNKIFKTADIPKVVGGVTAECSKHARELYGQVFKDVIPVSSTVVAEMVKLLENTFRIVNIGLVNEIALMCDKMDIDVWEVIDAAASKPFGFMPFYPGPGLGGHCIPVDPFYLSWKAKLSGYEARFIELAGQINSSMPYYVVSKVADALNESWKALNGSKILILGVAYKSDIDDTRESPALDIIHILESKGATVDYCDPHVPVLKADSIDKNALECAPDLLRAYDCSIIVTAHKDFDYDTIVANSRLIVDTRNALASHSAANIRRI
jgi:UDP-N-acetyl-D-glucosamine dehydrogenase